MSLQTFRTTCVTCDENIESKVVNLTGDDIVFVDLLEGLDFECKNCGNTTYIELGKYTD